MTLNAVTNKGLSKTELKIISKLEFEGKYYFTHNDIANLFENKRQIINTLHTLSKKKRILRLSKNKYFLVPIKAVSGKWTDNPLILTDEMLNSRDYFIGGWYAAYYWQLTNQVPMQVDIYTTKRQGKATIMNKRFVFHRTTPKNLQKSVIQKIEKHTFRILGEDETKKWIKSKR